MSLVMVSEQLSKRQPGVYIGQSTLEQIKDQTERINHWTKLTAVTKI